MFYGLNTFLALYFMNRWHQTAAQGNHALGRLSGNEHRRDAPGGLAGRPRRPPDGDSHRVRRRRGVPGAVPVRSPTGIWALALLVPLAVFIFMPTSVLVVLGQEYLPHRVGMASGVTLGLAVSVGGMCAPFLGRLADRHGLETVLLLLLAVAGLAAAQTLALPPAGASGPARARGRDLTVAADSIRIVPQPMGGF